MATRNIPTTPPRPSQPARDTSMASASSSRASATARQAEPSSTLNNATLPPSSSSSYESAVAGPDASPPPPAPHVASPTARRGESPEPFSRPASLSGASELHAATPDAAAYTSPSDTSASAQADSPKQQQGPRTEENDDEEMQIDLPTTPHKAAASVAQSQHVDQQNTPHKSHEAMQLDEPAKQQHAQPASASSLGAAAPAPAAARDAYDGTSQSEDEEEEEETDEEVNLLPLRGDRGKAQIPPPQQPQPASVPSTSSQPHVAPALAADKEKAAMQQDQEEQANDAVMHDAPSPLSVQPTAAASSTARSPPAPNATLAAPPPPPKAALAAVPASQVQQQTPFSLPVAQKQNSVAQQQRAAASSSGSGASSAPPLQAYFAPPVQAFSFGTLLDPPSQQPQGAADKQGTAMQLDQQPAPPQQVQVNHVRVQQSSSTVSSSTVVAGQAAPAAPPVPSAKPTKRRARLRTEVASDAEGHGSGAEQPAVKRRKSTRAQIKETASIAGSSRSTSTPASTRKSRNAPQVQEEETTDEDDDEDDDTVSVCECICSVSPVLMLPVPCTGVREVQRRRRQRQGRPDAAVRRVRRGLPRTLSVHVAPRRAGRRLVLPTLHGAARRGGQHRRAAPCREQKVPLQACGDAGAGR